MTGDGFLAKSASGTTSYPQGKREGKPHSVALVRRGACRVRDGTSSAAVQCVRGEPEIAGGSACRYGGPPAVSCGRDLAGHGLEQPADGEVDKGERQSGICLGEMRKAGAATQCPVHRRRRDVCCPSRSTPAGVASEGVSMDARPGVERRIATAIESNRPDRLLASRNPRRGDEVAGNTVHSIAVAVSPIDSRMVDPEKRQTVR